MPLLVQCRHASFLQLVAAVASPHHRQTFDASWAHGTWQQPSVASFTDD
nr:unnamed protein product [Digitaria exilis]